MLKYTFNDCFHEHLIYDIREEYLIKTGSNKNHSYLGGTLGRVYNTVLILKYKNKKWNIGIR